eukprot:Gb_37376 [translate_table: standard]
MDCMGKQGETDIERRGSFGKRRGDKMIYPMQEEYPPAISYVEAQSYKKWRSWIIPLFVVANIVVFIVTMVINDCPKKSGAPNKCVLRFMGRVSFQPLKENPLFGPSSSTQCSFGKVMYILKMFSKVLSSRSNYLKHSSIDSANCISLTIENHKLCQDSWLEPLPPYGSRCDCAPFCMEVLDQSHRHVGRCASVQVETTYKLETKMLLPHGRRIYLASCSLASTTDPLNASTSTLDSLGQNSRRPSELPQVRWSTQSSTFGSNKLSLYASSSHSITFQARLHSASLRPTAHTLYPGHLFCLCKLLNGLEPSSQSLLILRQLFCTAGQGFQSTPPHISLHRSHCGLGVALCAFQFHRGHTPIAYSLVPMPRITHPNLSCNSNGGSNMPSACQYFFSNCPIIQPAHLESMGALEWSKVAKEHQGWRLITCIWLHAGVVHLLANMLSLIFIGIRLEQEFGFGNDSMVSRYRKPSATQFSGFILYLYNWNKAHFEFSHLVKIGMLYLLSGFGGSLMSALFIQTSISVGASGALFGLLGAMLSELITNWTIYDNKRAAMVTLIFIIVINLAVGILPHVDNFAHIGGFLSGFLLGFVFLIRPQFGWVNRKKVPPGYELDSSVKSKHKAYQYVLWLLALILLIIG